MVPPAGGGELSPHPDKPLLYFSPMILERRQRLLRETRRMIAEDGLDGFSVRKLCQRAEVAQRTLYNAFHNKDRLIAFAIREAYEEYQSFLRHRHQDWGTLAAMLATLIGVNKRNFRVRNYTKAVCSLYFSPSTPRDVWETLRNMSLVSSSAWLHHRRDDLQPWVNIDRLAHQLANTQYATINDWCIGRISDEEYLPRMAEDLLTLLIGVARGDLADEARGYLKNILQLGNIDQFLDYGDSKGLEPLFPET